MNGLDRDRAYEHMKDRRALQLKAFMALIAVFLLLMKGAVDASTTIKDPEDLKWALTWLQVVVCALPPIWIGFVWQIEHSHYKDRKIFDDNPPGAGKYFFGAWAATWTTLTVVIFALAAFMVARGLK